MSYYCNNNGCSGLLLESPVVLLTAPADHMYQCLSCNHRYLRKDNVDEVRSDYNQKRFLHFNDFSIAHIEWELKIKGIIDEL